MIVDFHKWRNAQIEQWSIVEAVTVANVVDDIDPSNLDISLIVAGVEIDFLDFMRLMFNMTEKNVKEYAQEIIKNKIGDIYNAIGDLEEYATEKVNSIVDWGDLS